MEHPGFSHLSPRPRTIPPVTPHYPICHPALVAGSKTLTTKILSYLAEDLNISKVIALLHETAKEIKTNNDQNLKIEFAEMLDFLGLSYQETTKEKVRESEINESEIEEQIALRLKAKEEKNFKLADEIRQNLLAKGIVLEDISKNSTTWKR